MALTKKDVQTIKKVVIEGVNEGISQLVLPQLDNIYNRLTGVESRLDGVEGRLTSVEGRLTGVEGRLTSVEGRLTSVEGRLTSVEGRLENLESGQDQILRKFTYTQDRLDDHSIVIEKHEKRIARLELRPAV